LKPKRERPQLPAEAWEKPDNLPSNLWAVYDSWTDGEPLWSPDQQFLLLRSSYNKLPALMCIPLDRSIKSFVLADDTNQVASWIRQ